MERMNCQVELLSPILDDVYDVVLKPQQSFDYVAGQYLQVVMANDDKRPFTIANAPGEQHLQLHIGAAPGNLYAGQVLERMRTEGQIDIEMPFGRAGIAKAPERDVLIMVGGTGFSYAKALVEALNQIPHSVNVYLYWGGRNLGGLYLYELAQQWHDAGQVQFEPVIEQSIAQWKHHTGLVHEAVLSDFASLKDVDVYVAGRFEMAAVARDAFFAKGLVASQLHGDAYEFI